MTKCPPSVASTLKAGFSSSRESQSSMWTGGLCMNTPKDGFIMEPVFFTVANTITSNGHVIVLTRTSILKETFCSTSQKIVLKQLLSKCHLFLNLPVDSSHRLQAVHDARHLPHVPDQHVDADYDADDFHEYADAVDNELHPVGSSCPSESKTARSLKSLCSILSGGWS